MKRINLFVIFWILIGIVLLLASMFYKTQSDAIVAQVDPQKIAISFQKPVKIKSIHVIPGQDVKKGDLLAEVVRPDLMYDVDKATNDLNTFLQEKDMFITNINYQIQMNRLEKLSEIERIDEDIFQLRTQYEQNKGIKEALEGIDIYEDSSSLSFENSLLMQIDFQEKKKEQVEAIYNQKTNQLEEKKKNEIDIYDLKIEQQRKELRLLENEANFLLNYAPVDGTIGDVTAQVGELISPYSTILSLYEINPTVIKAFMNEKNRYNLKVGDEVSVESANRTYSISGVVIEIGSRIVTYPNRLLEVQDRKIWGQEIFVKIPEDNQFLNGEKVYVRAQ
jgi:multidrug resistance efflux pump